MHDVRIATEISELGPRTNVWIDGRKFAGVVAVEYVAAVDEINRVTLTFYAGNVEVIDPC